MTTTELLSRLRQVRSQISELGREEKSLRKLLNKVRKDDFKPESESEPEPPVEPDEPTEPRSFCVTTYQGQALYQGGDEGEAILFWNPGTVMGQGTTKDDARADAIRQIGKLGKTHRPEPA